MAMATILGAAIWRGCECLMRPTARCCSATLGNDRYEKHLKQGVPTIIEIFEQHTPGSATEESVGRRRRAQGPGEADGEPI